MCIFGIILEQAVECLSELEKNKTNINQENINKDGG